MRRLPIPLLVLICALGAGAAPPALDWLRASWFYRRVVLIGGSGAVVAVALIWLLERALDMKLISA